MELSIDIQQAVKEDLPKMQIWKRDTEAIIVMLKHRKATLPHGSWYTYLKEISMEPRTATRLMKPKSDKMSDLEIEEAEVIEQEDNDNSMSNAPGWRDARSVKLRIPEDVLIMVEDGWIKIFGTEETLTEYKAKLGRARLHKG